MFSSSSHTHPPALSTNKAGDVLGFGRDYATSTLFMTLNGSWLGAVGNFKAVGSLQVLFATVPDRGLSHPHPNKRVLMYVNDFRFSP